MFEKPITGIVGPNGSGKSNISDAILWVMGEQSTRSLRSGKMEDVIFGGTQKRNQVGFAEVSLILDNSDGRLGLENTEVMITRRYYRSGESEYYINRTLVRLKDVNELLMDTGLGREGYSIIGQGKIADILSSKSKDRREIFEEAAGISRYRHRKEESERKLQQTDENLLRIGDKIGELELQIEPLREQAETARKYLLFRDELRGLEISVWLRDLETLRIRAAKAEDDQKTAKLALAEATRAFESGFEESEALSDEMRRCDIEADSVREMISSEESRLNELESAIAVSKSRMEGNAGQIESLSLDIQSQENRQGGVGAQISERESRLREIASDRLAFDARAAELASEMLGISNLAGGASEELGALMNMENEVQSALSEHRSTLSALASQAQELFDMDNSVKQELSAAASTLEARSSDYESFSAELSKAREDAASLVNVANGLAIKARNRADKAVMSAEQLERLSFELKTIESRRNLLADMEKDYQGYSKAVKLVMQESARGSLKNIHGTVASLIKVEDKYTVAIETALGGAMQNIVVDTEEDGKAAINLLKKRDGGRGTFLPISTISGNILKASDVGSDDGFEGVALGLVEYDKKYAGIYASLLGRVIVADDLNSAVRIAKKHGYRYKVVTLDGQVMNTGGSMTGGSAAGNAGVLSRANEIAQLSGRIDVLGADVAKLSREHAERVREKTAAEYEMTTAQSELRAAEDLLIKLEGEDTLFTQLLGAAKEQMEAFGAEIASIEKRIAANSDDTKAARDAILSLEADAAAAKSKIEVAIRGQERLTEERERVNAAMSELRAGRASIDAEYEALTKAVVELSALRDEMSGNRDRQLEAIGELKSQNDRIRDEILKNERLCEAVAKQIDEYRQRLAGVNTAKLDIEAKRSSLNKDIQNMNQEMLEQERECSRLEQRILAAKMEENQIIDKLWDTYELSRSAAMSTGTRIENLAEAQRRISALKRQISELGNPNIGAIDEFARVNTRYSFLTSQRDDVEKAKGEIIEIINDITERMREIFTREFAVINESFGKTFKELFGGGRASLVLEDPDDVLNCGVEIQVQPPGKSLKTLTLLSGGEKAFVAIAIYFAILFVRPPPFVVMDEIDAALDDANVLRFASYMRRMSCNTQMLVISHKRATMEEADVLYGVTMQELGVSSILRIDLDEAERQIMTRNAPVSERYQ
ncbi:MAG: chromosome segregation protein SMC [Oscillospiraceae bacterium]|nr:chromosome segregation protein SMC [Oscillospiraceae bacterium]